jgi:hypothetical protein
MDMNDLFKAVMALDLAPIKHKLMHVESGEGWSLEKASAVEEEYRRFLCLMKMFPEEDTAPLVDVDTFWHYHILDTMKYAADCEQAFGYFLHHYPYVGLRGGDDEQFRLDSGERMRVLYEATFGDAYPGAARTDQGSAFCAGPAVGKREAGVGDTAFCAGPAAKTAFCAGPAVKTAFCAGPAADTAFCAGPAAKETLRPAGALPSDSCAGPSARTAFCAGPASRTAFCAGPAARATRQARAAARDGGAMGKVNPVAAAFASIAMRRVESQAGR